MSAVTLETLRADFERERREFAGELPPSTDLLYRAIRLVALHLPASRYAEWDRRMSNDRLYEAATLYIIACSHGLNAAMLFKLSDGAIDPRVKV